MNTTDLLDFYAGLALAGVISKYSTDCGLKGSSEKCAQVAFRYATAMLEERKKHVNLSNDD
jgi:hypothetical protein